MYLKQLHIENNGPLRDVRLTLPFTPQGSPKPVILVGANGSGKTNLLSILADALFTAAAAHYTDVMQGVSPLNRPFFRVVGPVTTTADASGSFTILEFKHEQLTYLFKEKGGRVDPADARDHLPANLHPAVSWAAADNSDVIKEFAIPSEKAMTVFEQGVYVYFASSRSEIPHWLNLESLPSADFDLEPRLSQRLRKPIFVERGMDRFQRWLLSVLAELGVSGPVQVYAQIALHTAHFILNRVLGTSDWRFLWLGRQNPEKLGVCDSAGNRTVPLLRSLSEGQSTLLGIFGTILVYGDHGRSQGPLLPNLITGICLVDEIDAHMHVDLQHRALPELIKLFPNVQFIVSSHSPLFVLGMENAFGADGIAIIDMPSGTPIQAEAYAEFGRALKVLQDTQAFAAAIEAAAAAPGKAVVFLEGATDPKYLNTAVELLNRQALLADVEFEWIGTKGTRGATETGKDALNATLKVLRRKPHIFQRQVILLYDHDANKRVEDHDGHIHVRTMPFNEANTKRKRGIENLLPPGSIPAEMYERTKREKESGDMRIDCDLNKMRLCTHICNDKRDPADFAKFAAVLDMIEHLIAPPAEEAPAPAGPGSSA